VNDEDLFERIHQSPRDKYAQLHGDDPVIYRENKTGKLKIIVLIGFGFIIGYLFYYVRIRGMV
jgi:hypothetical protein